MTTSHTPIHELPEEDHPLWDGGVGAFELEDALRPYICKLRMEERIAITLCIKYGYNKTELPAVAMIEPGCFDVGMYKLSLLFKHEHDDGFWDWWNHVGAWIGTRFLTSRIV